MPKLYILLPVHNRKEITRGIIECLKRQTYRDFHLVLIDDGSTDGTAAMVKENIPAATVLTGRGDWWWAGSLQHGLDWLTFNNVSPEDVVLMINDDAAIDSEFIEVGLDELRLTPRTLLQATIYSASTREVLDTGVVYEDCTLQFRQAKSPEEINCLTTNGLFARWGDLAAVGGFHPILLPHYLSDYEFTIRAGRKGVKLAVSRSLKVWWNNETTGFRKFDESRFTAFLKSYFSKKSAINPVYWTSFSLLAGRFYHIPYHLLKIWKAAVVIVASHAVSAMK